MANVVHRDPFEDFFRGFFVRPVDMGGAGTGHPLADAPALRVDIREDAENYHFQAELPGVAKDDIQVQVDGAVVTLSAERKPSWEKRDSDRVLRTERHYGKLSRSFQLAEEIDDSMASARYQDGVLTLRLPKKAAPTAKRLTVE